MIKRIKSPGKAMWVDNSDRLGRILASGRIYERREIELMSVVIKKNHVVADIGANIGYHTRFFSALAKTVHAFEPDRNNFALLAQNIAGYENVNIYNMALSDYRGTGNLFLNPSNHGDHKLYPEKGRKSEFVNVETLDSILGNTKIDFIKMDTQGNELKIINGGEKVLRNVFGMLVEFWPYGLRLAGCNPIDLLCKLRDLKFKIKMVSKKNVMNLPPEPQRVKLINGMGDGFVNLFCVRSV
jgi:FkbM family methyltransferase